MRIKKILSPIFVASLSILISAQAFAANKVSWDGQAISAITQRLSGNPVLADEVALKEIGSFIDAKLKVIPLPSGMEIGVKDDDLKSNNLNALAEDEIKFALIPVILDDSITENSYIAENTTYRKYIVRTNINVLLCGYGGVLQNRVNFLYNIPMNGYGVVRSKDEPASTELLRKQFVSNAKQLIDKRFIIPQNIVDFMVPNIDKTKIYQVDTVKVASNAVGVNQLDEDMIKNEIIPYIARSYTGAYAATHPEYLVLPDNVSGNEWRKAVIKHIDANLSDGLEFEEGGIRPINLEITDYALWKAKDPKRTKDASFDDIWTLKVGLRDVNTKKMVQPTKDFTVSKIIGSTVEISPSTFYGYAARMLAKGK